MTISLSRIRRIIREEHLSEITGLDRPSDYKRIHTISGIPGPEPTDSTTIARLILGFTPIGLALDAYDMWSALVDKNPQMFALAAAGFIPGIGDLRHLRKSHLEEVAENLGPDGMARLQAQASEAVDATASSSNIGRISEPAVRRTSREFLDVEYKMVLDGSSYYVDFVRRSHNAPVEISFIAASAADAGELVYNMTGRGHPFKVLRGVLDTVADFTKRFPEEKSFVFRGFSGDDMAFNWGTTPVTKRTRVFKKFMERAISRDPELSTMVKKISDLSWADDPNTIKIDLNELKRAIREELNRSLLTEGLPLLLLAPGVTVTAGELAASAGVSLYIAYMWLQSQDGYSGPTYETPENMASDLNVSVEYVLSPDYVGRGPSQPHGGLDPSQVGGSPPGPMQPSTGGRPQRGSPGYQEYEAALREKEMIIARAREEISNMDIDISKIFDLDIDSDPDEKESKSIKIYCLAINDVSGAAPWSEITGWRAYLYFSDKFLLDTYASCACVPAWFSQQTTPECRDLAKFDSRSVGPGNIKALIEADPGTAAGQDRIKAWACATYGQDCPDYVEIQDYTAGEKVCGYWMQPVGGVMADPSEGLRKIAEFIKSDSPVSRIVSLNCC